MRPKSNKNSVVEAQQNVSLEKSAWVKPCVVAHSQNMGFYSEHDGKTLGDLEPGSWHFS